MASVAEPALVERRPIKAERPGLDRLAKAFFASVDSASLTLFRIGFGIVMAVWAAEYLFSGQVHELYVKPRFHFTWWLFGFVRPWPGAGMTLHFLALIVLALAIAAGFRYRAASILFALGFTYVFLLERTHYQNHYYLLTLVSWMMTFLPLNRRAAVDAIDGWAPRRASCPAWCLWLMRFHIALPYVFGGLAKLQPDWFAGEPLRTHLLSQYWPASIAPLLTSETTIALLTWGGLLFDLAIVPLLLWRPTRIPAYVVCVGFHLTNWLLFPIHVFPWLMILATTVFFDPAWPARLVGGAVPGPSAEAAPPSWCSLPRGRRWGAGLLVAYCGLQVLLPLRAWVYPGHSAWTERGHQFSWRMMMRSKSSAPRFYLTDPGNGRTGIVDLNRFVTPAQLEAFPRDPEMILQLAHRVGDEFQRETGRNAEIRALVLTSLNGRKPELLIDPSVDLMQQPLGFHARDWIMPQREPLRREAWKHPMNEWDRLLDLELPPQMAELQAARKVDRSGARKSADR